MIIWNYFLFFLLIHVLHAVFFKTGLSPTFLFAKYPESECFSGNILVDDSFLV